MTAFRSGYVSLVGRPNVGKSTLLNAVLGEKISIVASKPQTTRKRIVGVKHLPDAQIVFLDTPGIHKAKHRLGEAMVREAMESLAEVDVILFIVEPGKPGRGDLVILDALKGTAAPVFLIINKIDTVKKPELLPVIDAYHRMHGFRFSEIIPVSALTGDGVELLLRKICEYLKEGPRYYPEETITDQAERSLAAEIIREKIIERTEKEVPHSVAVEVTQWSQREDGIVQIHADIFVERESQKGIIIGSGGLRIKEIGTAARLDIETLLGTKVFLELWVKTKRDWRDNERMLRELGLRS
jgi:GTP-binding protein Era